MKKTEQEQMQIKLGNRMKTLRLQKGHTSLEKFAFDNDISRVLYSNYEAGRANPTYRNICKIVAAFEMTLKEFFNEGF